MRKYRLDCYTELQYRGEKPAMVLWFDEEGKAIQEGAEWVEYIHGYPAGAWFGVTAEEETEYFSGVLESASAKERLPNNWRKSAWSR